MSLRCLYSNESLFDVLRPLGGLLVLGGLVLGLAACDGSTVAGPDGAEADAPVSMAFSAASAPEGTASGGTASTSKAASGPRILIGPDGNQLRLDRVQMVVREIELDRATGDENCSPEDRPDAEEDDCAEVESGPVLVSLPLDGDAPAVVVDTTLPTGRWDEVEFEVHKPEAESATPDFLEGTDFPLETSIRVQGRYTPAGGAAQDFTYTSDLNAEREIEFEPPLEVTADNTNNVTFSVNVDAWFRRADSTLVNPARVTEGGAFEDRVEENIESSIEGFEDDDRDGRDDEEEAEDEEEEDEEDENEIEIEKALENVGPDSDASGEVEFEKEADKAVFTVEVEDLTMGTYEVVVADTARGELDVTGDEGEAEIGFRRPSEEGHPRSTSTRVVSPSRCNGTAPRTWRRPCRPRAIGMSRRTSHQGLGLLPKRGFWQGGGPRAASQIRTAGVQPAPAVSCIGPWFARSAFPLSQLNACAGSVCSLPWVG